jgi:hypothetical protein
MPMVSHAIGMTIRSFSLMLSRLSSKTGPARTVGMTGSWVMGGGRADRADDAVALTDVWCLRAATFSLLLRLASGLARRPS